jgi:hypothetical protein
MTGFDPENVRIIDGTPVSNEGIVFDVRVGQPTFGDGTNESSGLIPQCRLRPFSPFSYVGQGRKGAKV